MTNANSVYSELKSDIQAVAKLLFEFAEICLRKRGNFLPHAAVLADHGEVNAPLGGGEHENDRVLSLHAESGR